MFIENELGLSKENVKKLKSLAVKKEIEVTEMTYKILSDYLKR